ncbi:DUF1492 domain-containing protein [Tissierella praeacuta]|uniref:DUF1492 domain-containing protein n=1 Tax=Tissierella praeacuta TaxID=43131 RepID=UPI003513476B
MNAKEYLSQARWLDQRINSKLEQKEQLEALATRVTVNFTQEKVLGGGATTSPMEDATVKLIDLCHEINDDIDELIRLKAEILETISKVDDPVSQLLLQMRYIESKTWEEVAYALRYNNRTVFKIHGRALKEIEKIQNGQ